jgi:hypothetical protein
MNVTIKHVGIGLALGLLGGCATSPPLTLTNPVGPAKIQPEVALKQGRLIVYSASYFGTMDGDIERYVHSGYTIYRPDGQKVRAVNNQTGIFDGDPEKVGLPVGRYRIEAEANGVGRISVPVVIEQAQTTVVDLNGEWWPDHALADRVVRLPNGTVIGAQAQ